MSMSVLYERGSYIKRAFEHLARMVPPPVNRGSYTPSLLEILAALKTVLRLGVISPSRWTFWKSLIGVIIKFPKRMRHFFAYCIALEHYYVYRRTIKDQLTTKLPIIQHEVELEGSCSDRPARIPCTCEARSKSQRCAIEK